MEKHKIRAAQFADEVQSSRWKAGIPMKSHVTKLHPPIQSKTFDRPLRNFSGRMSDEGALEAISLVKEKRPDSWERFTQHEKRAEGYADIGAELDALLMKEMGASSILACVELKIEIRKEVRRQAKLPY